MKEISDNELMRIVLSGNDRKSQKALGSLYKRYAQELFGYIFFYLNKNEELARDIVHDIFLQLLERKYRFDTSRELKPWLFTLASNKCKNEFRKLKVIQKNAADVQHHFSQLSEEQSKNTEIKLWEAVNLLDDNQKEAIILRYRMNYTVKEIAKLQNCPEGTIKSRLFHAIKKLSLRLEKQSVEYFNN